MQYKAKEPDRDTAALITELEPIVNGLGCGLVELALYRSRKKAGVSGAQVRLVVTKSPLSAEDSGGIGTAELSRLHRALLPRLELALDGADLYLEVSSPGTDRIIKDGAEFRHYSGKAVKCWQTDAWLHGVLRGSDTEKITLETADGIRELKYETIAKAKLDG
jgi:ribosome maturation factor RimP